MAYILFGVESVHNRTTCLATLEQSPSTLLGNIFFHYQGEDSRGLSCIHMALRSTPFQRELTRSFFAECVHYALLFNKRTIEHNNKNNNNNNIQHRAI